MSLFQIKGEELVHIREKNIDLEKRIQNLVEKNLDKIFDLDFVASEFSVRDLRIDTLAYDPSTRSFVIIEYKRDKDTSIVDQGLAYLNLLLNNKAEFVLKYYETKGKNLDKSKVQWDSSRVIFIANEFTKHQELAASFKDLPIELWEVELYENDVLKFTRIKTKTDVSLKSLSKNKILQKVTHEIKTYSIDDPTLFGQTWVESKELFKLLKTEISALEDGISEKVTKFYIAFLPKSGGRSFVEVVPQKKGLKVYIRPKLNEIKNDTKIKLEDCSIKGHWTNGNSYFTISKKDELQDAMKLIKQAFDAEN